MSNLYHILGDLSGYNPYFIRHKIANYMITNPKINGESIDKLIKGDTGLELEEYVGNLRKGDTHFGSYEIKVYCDCIYRNVILYNHDGIPITFYSDTQTDIYDVISYDGNKYSKKDSYKDS